MIPLLVTVLALLGLAVGSFLNVVIWRVPRGMSVVSPPSACPGCGAKISARDNVPVLSWIALRGACRSCSARISARYPAIELLTMAAFAAIALWRLPALVVSSDSDAIRGALELTALLLLAACSIALTAIDLELHRLPNPIVLVLAAGLLALLGCAAVVVGDVDAIVRALIAGAVAFAVLFAVAFIKPGGFGFGDVKLAGALGIPLGYVGWEAVIVGFFAAFLLGGVVGIVLIITRKVARGGGIPFGPWLFAGAWIGIIAGADLVRLYLAAVGIG